MHTQRILVTRMIAAFVVGGLLGVAMLYAEPYSSHTASFLRERSVAPALSSEVVYYKDVRGYLAQPGGNEERPAIILIHESWGLNEDMEAFARQYANEGYVALAVDLFEGEATDDPLRHPERVAGLESDRERVFSNLRGAVQYLSSKENVDPARLAVVGWGIGGTWAYRMAESGLGTRASVVYYGEFDPQGGPGLLHSSILGHFAELDTSIDLGAVREMEAGLEALHVTHEIYLYPQRGHGFANEREGNALFNKEASDLAWSRTVEFLVHALEED